MRDMRAKKYNQEHAKEAAEFQKSTGIDPTNIAGVKKWQSAHSLAIDGKIGPATLAAAQREGGPQEGAGDADAANESKAAEHPGQAAGKHGSKQPKGPEKAEHISFTEEDAGAVTLDGGAPDMDATEIVDESDTSHNRHEDEEEKRHRIAGKDVGEIAEFITSTLDSMKVPYIGKTALIAKLVLCNSVREIYEVLKAEVTPECVTEVMGKLAKFYFLPEAAEYLESGSTYLGGVSVGLTYANLSMEYILGRANELGERKGQLNRYAAAWAFRFFDESYTPDMLSPLDEQMELMNVCSRLGVEDADKTLAQLGERVESIRESAIKHYGDVRTARENIALELLKQSGAK